VRGRETPCSPPVNLLASEPYPKTPSPPHVIHFIAKIRPHF
jgi:hypothetical protein